MNDAEARAKTGVSTKLKVPVPTTFLRKINP